MYEYIPFSIDEEPSSTDVTTSARHSNHRNVNSQYKHWPLGNSNVATRCSCASSPFSRREERSSTNVNPLTHTIHAAFNNINYVRPIYSDQPDDELDGMANHHEAAFNSIKQNPGYREY